MFWYDSNKSTLLKRLLTTKPSAVADIKGMDEYAALQGKVSFHSADEGVLVVSDISGLPDPKGVCGGVFGFHIHAGDTCSGDKADPLAKTLGHFNPKNCEHPYHAGDMPPLFSNRGFAWSAFYTERFNIFEIIGKTVVIHDMPDDFRSQPSGNSGKKIACGVIQWQ